jgi:hypothetical protein
MPKRRTLEDEIASLHEQASDPSSTPARAALVSALCDKRSALVAVAATQVERAGLLGLEPQLLAAFDRFMGKPDRTDKGCLAKNAIASALYRLEVDACEVFLRGVRHVQLEPVWGGKQDTAVELRVTSALGLVRNHHPDSMLELARLLADPEAPARAGAASAIAYSGQVDAGVALLRFKALLGDEDPRVMGACCAGLLTLDPERSLQFVAELLERDDERCEAAAIALGESRLPGAFAVLAAACERAVTAARRATPMLALAMLRSERAFDYLLAIVADAAPDSASKALEALALFAHDRILGERVLATTGQRGDVELHRRARQTFAPPAP